ncbi:MAG: MFS transporter [Fusobacteria bacterium]|nr:MFS transporter [Fusobacteriota bacterium]
MIQLAQKQKTKILIIMTSILFMTMAGTDIYVPALPEMVRFFHSTSTVVNLTLTIYNFGIAIGVLFIGEISNRFGRKKVLISGTALFSLTALLIPFSHSIGLIIFLRLLQAFGTSTVVIVPRLIFKDYLNEREQIKSNGIFLIGVIVSPAISPVIGAYIAHYFNWQMCFVVNGLLALILTLYCAKILPETNLEPIRKFAALKEYTRSYLSILTNKTFLAFTLIYAGAIGAFFAFISVSSYIYINDWHWSDVNYSYLFLLFSGAYLVGNVVMQRLNKKKTDPLKIISIGVYSTFGGAIILLLAIFFTHSILIAAVFISVGAIFMRAANAIINPVIQVRLMNIFSKKSAHALGLNMCISYSIGGVATFLVTVFPQWPLPSLVVVSVFFVIICVLSFTLSRKHFMR